MATESPVLDQIRDESRGVVLHLEPDSPVTIVAFGAHAQHGTVPPFAFHHAVLEHDVKGIFVRDHYQVWFHRGAVGAGEDVEGLADYLREVTADAERVVTIGSSGGAYAALLFGALLDCEAHAFSPMTHVEPDWVREHGDHRQLKQLKDLETCLNVQYADLVPLLEPSTAPAHVYLAEHHAIDNMHVNRIAHLDQVTIERFDFEEHGFVRELRDRGWLRELLARIAAGEPT